MDSIKKNLNKIYIGVTAAAIAIALILCIDYAISRKAEKSESAQTATTIAEKEKKDKVYISVSTESIRDGLANMGVLVTQEYYSSRRPPSSYTAMTATSWQAWILRRSK